MDREAIALEAQRLIKARRDADTPENEARLRAELEAQGGKLVRIRGKNPQRYRMKLKNGSIEPVTLFDVEARLARVRRTKPD